MASITSGSLGASAASAVPGLEDPKRMRTSTDNSFPQGHGLILENIDGFSNPPVFRKSPHLLNLSRTAPFGFSGNIPDLQTFAAGAVIQHFPRTLARNAGGGNPDFRLPTSDELVRIEAFLLAQEFPAGDDPNKLDLDRFATTLAQRQGRANFFGLGSSDPTTRCGHCHGGPTLSQLTVPIMGRPVGVNASLNTGVVDNFGDRLPCEPSTPAVGPCGSREFSVASLFNVKNLTPLFHDGSANTVNDAVNFYINAAFNNSPAGRATAINLGALGGISTFLEGLVVRPYTLSEGPVRFGAHPVLAGLVGVATVVCGIYISTLLEIGNVRHESLSQPKSMFYTTKSPTAPAAAAMVAEMLRLAAELSHAEAVAYSDTRGILRPSAIYHNAGRSLRICSRQQLLFRCTV